MNAQEGRGGGGGTRGKSCNNQSQQNTKLQDTTLALSVKRQSFMPLHFHVRRRDDLCAFSVMSAVWCWLCFVGGWGGLVGKGGKCVCALPVSVRPSVPRALELVLFLKISKLEKAA